MDYLRQTGIDSLAGADILAAVPGKYESSVEYGSNPIAKALRDVARIHTAGVGTRIFYTNHVGWDTHSHQPMQHPGLLRDATSALADFMTDLREHEAAEEVAIPRLHRVRAPHARQRLRHRPRSAAATSSSARTSRAGLYSEYPSLDPKDWAKGEDLEHTIDFRGIFGTMADQWMGQDPHDIVVGDYEQVHPFKQTLVAN